MTEAQQTTILENFLLWRGPGSVVEEGMALLIKGHEIQEIGTKVTVPQLARRVDLRGTLVMPGWQQTHVHACQTIFRGMAENLPLLRWLREYIWPLEAAHDEESIRMSALLTAAELIRGGTTAVFCFETVRHTGVTAAVMAEAGLRATVAPCLMDEQAGFPPLAVDTDSALRATEDLDRYYQDHPRLRIGLAPRFALGCHEKSMRAAAEMAKDKQWPLHTHSSEQREEVEFVRRLTGRGNVKFLHDCGVCGPNVALVHGVHLDPGDLELLRESGTSLVHCPSANAKLGSGIAPIPDLRAAGIPLSLGADGAPCNNRLDMFQEIRLAGMLQSLARGPGVLPPEEILDMATNGGSRFFRYGGQLGYLRPGARADLIAVSQTNVGVVPSESYLTNLVYGNLSTDVVLTMVDGEILYERGVFAKWDWAEIQKKSEEQRILLRRRAGC